MKKRAIWVFENIQGTHDFYTSLRVLMCVASVINWKKWNNTINILHLDSATYSFFKDLNLLKLWDEVHTNIIDEPCEIDKLTFWSSSKLRVLKEQDICVAMVDWDFIAFSNIIDLDNKSALVYSCDEDGNGVYPGASDPYINQLKDLPEYLKRSINNDAINVSYLCFNDFEFQKEYAEESFKCMLELSKLNAPSGNVYVCFAEQKLLKQLALHREIKHRPLIKNQYNALRGEWSNNMNELGFWYKEMMLLKFEHYGPAKSLFKKEGAEFKFLYNSLKNKLNSKVIKAIIDID